MKRTFVIGGEIFLVLVTLLFLSSIGGAMALGAPILIPLHWWAARHSGPWMAGVWASLAALSAAEAVWIYTYPTAFWMPIAAGCAAVVLFFGTASAANYR